MFPYYFIISKKDTGGGCWGGTKGRKNPDQGKCFFLTFFFFFFLCFLCFFCNFRNYISWKRRCL